MIEAPEALYLCEQLNKTVKGKRITNVFTLFTLTNSLGFPEVPTSMPNG